eukprot:CAMPEP_0195112092 /NCGR_PEP_ID=MMETSP0448-20130528/98157_1 /TAXON_ID=66468 /ORGANISM="Heterocapsa triquestra, Strain CCMP 448" /LENGTH=47 /DNA_ID= /DNA_START= /DNA_END= /DNA_ORIENTATION=
MTKTCRRLLNAASIDKQGPSGSTAAPAEARAGPSGRNAGSAWLVPSA